MCLLRSVDPRLPQNFDERPLRLHSFSMYEHERDSLRHGLSLRSISWSIRGSRALPADVNFLPELFPNLTELSAVLVRWGDLQAIFPYFAHLSRLEVLDMQCITNRGFAHVPVATAECWATFPRLPSLTRFCFRTDPSVYFSEALYSPVKDMVRTLISKFSLENLREFCIRLDANTYPECGQEASELEKKEFSTYFSPLAAYLEVFDVGAFVVKGLIKNLPKLRNLKSILGKLPLKHLEPLCQPRKVHFVEHLCAFPIALKTWLQKVVPPLLVFTNLRTLNVELMDPPRSEYIAWRQAHPNMYARVPARFLNPRQPLTDEVAFDFTRRFPRLLRFRISPFNLQTMNFTLPATLSELVLHLEEPVSLGEHETKALIKLIPTNIEYLTVVGTRVSLIQEVAKRLARCKVLRVYMHTAFARDKRSRRIFNEWVNAYHVRKKTGKSCPRYYLVQRHSERATRALCFLNGYEIQTMEDLKKTMANSAYFRSLNSRWMT